MKKFAAALALGLVALTAHADVVSSGFGTPTLGLQGTPLSQTGTLNLFDSRLGRLTDVTLTLYGASTTRISFTNTTARAIDVNANGVVDLNFSSSLAALDAVLGAPAFSLDAPAGPQSLAVGQTVTVGPLARNDSLVLNSALDAFISSFAVAGGGTFTLSCEALTNVTGVTTGVTITQTTDAACGASIAYAYDPASNAPPVPEPASLALTGLALAAAGLAMRRSRKG